MRWTRLGLMLLGLASMVTVGSARGQDLAAASAEFGPERTWNASCEIDRMTDVRKCRLLIYQFFDQGRRVGLVALSLVPAGADYHLILTTSEGLLDSCALRVDRAPRIETQIATINMCMFPNFLGRQMLEQFRDGAAILARISFPRIGSRDFDFTLNGFSRAFDEMERTLQ